MVDKSENKRRNRIQVIARAASILRLLRHHQKGLTLGEIAERVKLPRSTVQRIVDALADEALVIPASPTIGVRLGPALMDLALSSRLDIVEYARPVMEQIAKETGETVDLAIPDRDQVLCVYQIEGTYMLGVSGTGFKFPLHCCANGKAVLAALTDDRLHRLRERLQLTRMTKNTIVDWEQLDCEIARIRRQGVAFDQEENVEGICAVGIAFRAPTDELAVISVPVPTHRFATKKNELARLIAQYCAVLQQTSRP